MWLNSTLQHEEVQQMVKWQKCVKLLYHMLQVEEQHGTWMDSAEWIVWGHQNMRKVNVSWGIVKLRQCDVKSSLKCFHEASLHTPFWICSGPWCPSPTKWTKHVDITHSSVSDAHEHQDRLVWDIACPKSNRQYVLKFLRCPSCQYTVVHLIS